MARIRTIKPEFWTDEKVVQLPFFVRLLFVGLWNFADDEGFVIEEPSRIQMQVLPGDNVDVPGGIDLLVASGLLERGELLDTRRFLQIVNFQRHQKVSNPTPSKIARENYRKLAIPKEVRRQVATKYGCKPGGVLEVECYCCGAQGKIWWPCLSSGRPGAWVSFSGLELSHFDPEAQDGATACSNLVLCCQFCNRSMGTKQPIELLLQKVPEKSIPLNEPYPTEWNGEGEGKGVEGKGEDDCNEAATRPSLPTELAYPDFGCTKGRRSGSITWTLTTEFISELQQTFEGIDVAAECRKAWQWHKTNWAKRKTADGMPEFLRRWLTRAQNSGRGTPRVIAPASRLPTPEDDANWTPHGSGGGV